MITRVGSTSLAKRSREFSARLIRGRAGTPVTLTVQHGAHRQTITIVRASINQPVAASRILNFGGTKLGYVRLTSFTQGSGDEVRAQVNRVRARGAKALILDLRDNGGGLLEEGVNVASIFIPDGTIVSTDGRNQPRQVYMAKGHAIPTSIPLVVLVDHNTASAAEIVTGALQDRGRAKVVGTRTYGKGVFQEIQPLANGGALDFTIGEYFTPSGRNLGGGGVRRGAGVRPNVYAFTGPRSHTDSALTEAEKTVAAELR
jgi:carboxyl-terminal processing protease